MLQALDTVTQAVLGGAIAEAAFRHKLGGRAVAFGAACGLMPDLDVLMRLAGEWQSLVYHRGASHSLLILPFVALPVGAAGARWLGGGQHRWTWVHLAFWALITHPLLDVFTTYGTQLFAPFSRARFALDGVAIIDPIYTVPLLISMVWAARRSADRAKSRRFAQVALAFGLVYLCAGWALSALAQNQARNALQAQGVTPVSMRSPTPVGFSLLRRVVAKDAKGILHINTWSPLAEGMLPWVHLLSDEDPKVDAALASEEGQIMLWFSDGYLYSKVAGRQVRMEDQRYGLYRDLRWTPFSAVAHFDEAGALQSVRRGPRGLRPDIGAELSAGWDRLWGRAPVGNLAQHRSKQHSLH